MNKFTIYVIIQHTKSLLMHFFVLNMKIYKILRSTIRSHDPRSHLSLMILFKIMILTTLVLFVQHTRNYTFFFLVFEAKKYLKAPRVYYHIKLRNPKSALIV